MPTDAKVDSQRFITLRKLYDFIAKHGNNAEALRLEKTTLGKEYCKICDDLVEPIDEERGFYLWGAYDRKGYWKNIYLGKAGYGDGSSLKKRIREELKDERCGLWRSVYGEEELLTIGAKIHPATWPKYKSAWKRAMRKAGTTHIIWVPAPRLTNDHVKMIEPDLIEALNPTANHQRPAPPKSLQKETTQIFSQFRATVHGARESKYRIDPA
jgi:hypothetical protein